MSGDVPWSSTRELHVGPTLFSVPEVILSAVSSWRNSPPRGGEYLHRVTADSITLGDALAGTLVVPGVSWDDVPTGVSWEEFPSVGGSVVLPAVAIGIVLLTGVVLIAWRMGIIPRAGRRRYDWRLSGSARYSLAFAGLGIASLGGWFVRGGEPSSPLLYFGGVGLFGGVLAPLLLSGRTVSPVVAEGLHEALLSTAGRDADGPSGATVYYPGQDGSDPLSVRACMLDTGEHDLDAVGDTSSSMAPDGPFRSRPSGAALYRAFRAEAISEIATDPDSFAWQLCQGLTDWLELVAGATLTAKATDGITIRVAESSVPGVGAFDHPVVSFLGVAFACNREQPVVVTARPTDVGSGEYGISIYPFAGARPQPAGDAPATRNGRDDRDSNGGRRRKPRSGGRSGDGAHGGSK